MAISVVVAALMLALLTLSFTKNNKSNCLEDTGNETEYNVTPHSLRTNLPAETHIEGNIALQRGPRDATRSALCDEEKWPSGRHEEAIQTRVFDNTQRSYPRLSMTPKEPQGISHPSSTTRAQLPMEFEIMHPHTQPLSPVYQSRSPLTWRPLAASDFADATTVLGTKDDRSTLCSESLVEDDRSKRVGRENRWVPLGNKEVGLLGRHWE
ncbi:hypothetical protein GMOD_00007349 [Pyrenophora seminiperda CCB06]|uniref:Uncharacterized protein n=1 Tax=Pyrenophora seminiperda CCB06 TaxID=1302712 RepID=A0A3M7MCX2_9PLEO|nr:hypothetical protein GMOD_00007349 [Pyrenophora seminiperda CCB06]